MRFRSTYLYVLVLAFIFSGCSLWMCSWYYYCNIWLQVVWDGIPQLVSTVPFRTGVCSEVYKILRSTHSFVHFFHVEEAQTTASRRTSQNKLRFISGSPAIEGAI